MLTKEENELLTRIGPGTPAGELLRRYWHPVSVINELTEEAPTKLIRILGEDLVLFRDKSGRIGLIEDRCAHRGASMFYGRVEARGIACPYHGWLFDTEGNCLETPAEPAESKFHLRVKHKAYPVQKFIGLYWTYMGPNPAPAIPKYDLWVRKDGTRRLLVQPQLDCNWFQAMENSVDPSHLQVLHQTSIAGGRIINDTTRGLTDDVAQFDFCEFPHGIIKKRIYKNGAIDEHPVLFPNILRQSNATQIRVPMDDSHTKIFFVRFDPSADGSIVDQEETLPVEYVKSYKNPPDALHPFTRFRMDEVQAQDHMAWETQGPISDRTCERLATADRGIVMLREMMRREIDKVKQGLDPLGIMRDPGHAMIDSKLAESLNGPEYRRELRDIAA
jgi:5,5'-dehydrodivanillate O-demethylase